MLKKLLITSLLFTALFTLSCEKLKEAAGTVTGSVTGIEKTYAGTWNASATTDFNSIFYSSTMTVNEDGSMTYRDMSVKEDISFESIAIVKLGNTYTATYTAPNDEYTLTLVIKFDSETQATISYTKKMGNNTTTENNGIFNKQ
ncbi:hypothetical protein [Brachyspira hampsonii]|uniref:hypothetical protein n=1 Tax=Brachyspira hampsonii TaxID=1287055 RepID=UPI000D3AF444|nr:hypothetical protein [Brachyspira hampsonii]PTY41061.1 hypothetical protein DQ06_11160 [Brachyspira hampsonii bv. II]